MGTLLLLGAGNKGSASGVGGDPHFANVVLLLGFEGADGATGTPGMDDESLSAHGTATVAGNAQIDTGNALTGTASLLLDGTGDQITFPDDGDWTLASAGSDPWTIEFDLYWNSRTTDKAFLSWTAGLGGLGFYIRSDTVSSSEINWLSSADGSSFNVNFSTSGAGLANGVKYKICVEKNASGKHRIYVDGVMKGSSTVSTGIFNSTSVLYVGGDPSGGRNPDCSIDEIRITKGVARYDSDSGYTPEAGAFPRS